MSTPGLDGFSCTVGSTGQPQIAWRDRAHFFGLAAQMMRRIPVDHARARLADKRGAGAPVLTLEWVEIDSSPCKLTKGDKENAVKYYRLAVEKNPGNSDFEKRLLQSSKAKLKELGVEIN